MLEKCSQSTGIITLEPIVYLLRGNQRRRDDGSVTYDWIATLVVDEDTAILKGMVGKFDRQSYKAIDSLLRNIGIKKLTIKRSKYGKTIEKNYT